MSEVLSSITGALSGPTGSGISKLAQLLLGGAGIVGNITQSSAAAGRQKMLDELAKNPALLAQKIKALQQPLSTGLVQDVTNTTQAQLGERGLSTSPQIAAAVEGQALAPYEVKAQEDAQNAFFQSLGLDVGGAHSLPGPPSDTSGFWKLFQSQATPSPSTPGITYPSTPSDSGSGNPMEGVLF